MRTIIFLFPILSIISFGATIEPITEQAISMVVVKREVTENQNEKTDKNESAVKSISEIEKAMIYVENEEYDKALVVLKKIEKNKREFNYYYLMGKIDIKKGEKVEAIKNLEKAEELNKENIQVKILLYELYYKTEGNQNKEKAKKEEILKSKMTEEEKEEFKKLAYRYDDKKIKEYMAECYTGITYTDNVRETKSDKKSEIGSINGITFGTVKTYENNRKLYLAGSYRNTIYFSNSDENNHNFIIASEVVKTIDNRSIAIPLSGVLALSGNEVEEFYLLSGINLKKKISKKMENELGVEAVYKNNSLNDYKGVSIYPYTAFRWTSRMKIKYDVVLKFADEIYDKDEYKNIGAGLEIDSSRKIMNKYILRGNYRLEYKKYNQDDRKDWKKLFKIECEIPVWKEGVKLITAYEYSADVSNVDTNDYTKNSVSMKIKKEF